MKRGATKNYVLNMLEQNKGEYVTGMQIASDLGISRNAVWKAVNELKKDGYVIHSISRKGYALDTTSDILSAAAIKRRLLELSSEYGVSDDEIVQKSIETVADNIIIFDSLESTNQTAKVEMITGALNKKIIIAKEQTAAINHNREIIATPEGGIYMSIALDDKKYLKSEVSPKFIGETVKKALEEVTGKTATLSDDCTHIYFGKKMVCGIKSEYFADLETNNISAYIIGIAIKDLGISANDTIARILIGFGL